MLPLWERAFPNDNGPHTWLKAARDVMTGQCGAANFQKMREEGWAHCDDLVYEHQELQNTVAVGYAALQVLRIALWDNLYPESHLVTDLSEDECDPEDTDCAFCAACAWAGGTKWDETSSAEQRLAFWRWWLTEAVPAAWLANPPQ